MIPDDLVSRRSFLALTAVTPIAAGASKDKHIPIGLELYSVRDQCKTNLPGTLAQVSKIGYKGVEFAGYYDRSAKELRKMLEGLNDEDLGRYKM